ncbi:hypothetical protein HNQ34_001455 [Anoxybacillus tepidamans]|uniref:Methionine/alanine importer small subunit n=1 Tax=Anoxybacteroides tepidamans TaxID=265948 RepID=A0A7W8IPS4_9BACL|nr:methionine/alanine import family NSS transporter small subunit [Anoxybacillus tepidamans]MBB5324362.1 hypothetical protein [Anoxybacillus tepidamans]
METSALVMMVVGMVVIWGGLVASIAHAIMKTKQRA